MLVQKTPRKIGRKRTFAPTFMAQSVDDIDFELLRQRGIKACFIDLDGTVVPRATFDVPQSIRDALRRSQLTVYIATNRPRSRDLKNLKDDLGAQGVIHPAGLFGKPFKRYFLHAAKQYRLQPQEIVMVGDRYLQDIYGANAAGLHSLLISRRIGKSRGLIDALISGYERWLTRRQRKHYEAIK